MEDLQSASKLLLKALKLRERYMKMSRQKFPTLVDAFICGSQGKEESNGCHSKPTIAGKSYTLLNLPKSAFNVPPQPKVMMLVNLLKMMGIEVKKKIVIFVF